MSTTLDRIADLIAAVHRNDVNVTDCLILELEEYNGSRNSALAQLA